MSIHLVGGGWSIEAAPELFGEFLTEAAARAAALGRMVPRIGMVFIDTGDELESAGYRAQYVAMLELVAPNQPVVSSVPEGGRFASAVLSDIDGLLVGGGPTPAYHAALEPLYDEIRLLVADGLPYLGFSAGAMIAADRAIIGGWRIGEVPVCPEEAGEELDEVTVVSGLGLVDLAIDVHAAQWGTLGRIVGATELGLVQGGVAIDESTALIIGDELTVTGHGNVWQVVEGPDGVVVGILGS